MELLSYLVRVIYPTEGVKSPSEGVIYPSQPINDSF